MKNETRNKITYLRLCWLSVALTVNPHIHYMKQLKHRYCHCRPLVVTFVYYEYGPLSCATKLTKVPHFCTDYCRDWNYSPVISPGDIWTLISWHLSFWGCKRHQAARPDSLVLLCSAMKKGFLWLLCWCLVQCLEECWIDNLTYVLLWRTRGSCRCSFPALQSCCQSLSCTRAARCYWLLSGWRRGIRPWPCISPNRGRGLGLDCWLKRTHPRYRR